MGYKARVVGRRPSLLKSAEIVMLWRPDRVKKTRQSQSNVRREKERRLRKYPREYDKRFLLCPEKVGRLQYRSERKNGAKGVKNSNPGENFGQGCKGHGRSTNKKVKKNKELC